MDDNGLISLTRRLQAGEEAAWQEYMSAFGRIIIAVGKRLGLNPTDREELFQNACVQVFKSIHSLRDPLRLHSWTYSVAYRTGVDALRRREIDTISEDREGRPVLDNVASEDPSPEDLREQLALSAHVRGALKTLSRACQDLLAALYLDEPRSSYQEVGRRLSMPVGSIGPTKARCLKRLSRALKHVSNGR